MFGFQIFIKHRGSNLVAWHYKVGNKNELKYLAQVCTRAMECESKLFLFDWKLSYDLNFDVNKLLGLSFKSVSL